MASLTVKDVNSKLKCAMSQDGTGVITFKTSINENKIYFDVYCMIDVSGSMGSEMLNPEGRSDGFNRLDIAKHATKTILNGLQDEDIFSLMTFSDYGKIIIPPTKINSISKPLILAAIERLQTEGGTNLWEGIKTVLDTFKKTMYTNFEIDNTRVRSAMILTDGEPSDDNHIQRMNEWINNPQQGNGKMPCILNFYGFTYNLKSELLNSLSKLGNGSFGFIPDAGFVGTTFVHALCNIATINGTDISVKINGSVKSVTGYDAIIKKDHTIINIGSIRSEMPLHIVFKTTNPSVPVIVEVIYNQVGMGINRLECASISTDLLEPAFLTQVLRSEVIDTINNSLSMIKNPYVILQIKENISSLAKKIGTSSICISGNPYILGLLQDVSGQITEAFSTIENFKKWGQHYLLALSGAHNNEMCTNFKDPGLQFYGDGDDDNTDWKDFRSEMDKIFCSMPPPTASCRQQSYSSYSSSYSAPAPLANMSSYYDSNGDCFTGESIILMVDGTKKHLHDIVKGDKIFCKETDSRTATVVCVVKMIKPNSSSKVNRLVNLGNKTIKPWITLYHPVRSINNNNNIWQYPINIFNNNDKPQIEIIDDELILYNLVLDSGHIATINNDFECATLGHNIRGSDVIEHNFFGTNNVIDSLRQFDGWSNGLVVLTDSNRKVIRDSETNKVINYERIN